MTDPWIAITVTDNKIEKNNTVQLIDQAFEDNFEFNSPYCNTLPDSKEYLENLGK